MFNVILLNLFNSFRVYAVYSRQTLLVIPLSVVFYPVQLMQWNNSGVDNGPIELREGVKKNSWKCSFHFLGFQSNKFEKFPVFFALDKDQWPSYATVTVLQYFCVRSVSFISLTSCQHLVDVLTSYLTAINQFKTSRMICKLLKANTMYSLIANVYEFIRIQNSFQWPKNRDFTKHGFSAAHH